MAIRILEYSDRQDILDLFESINYQIYDGYSNRLNKERIIELITDEEWFNNSSIYGNYIDEVLDCVNIVRNNEMLPIRINQWFYRYDIDNREMTEEFDSNLLSLLNESFRLENEAGHNFHMTMETTSIKEEKKKRCFEVTSYLKQNYNCSIIAATPADRGIYNSTDDLTIHALGEIELNISAYKEYFDQTKLHDVNIERVECLYYLKNEVL